MCFSYIQKNKNNKINNVYNHPLWARSSPACYDKSGPRPWALSFSFLASLPEPLHRRRRRPRYPVPTAAPATCRPKVRPLLLLLLLSYPSPRFTDVERRRPLACRAAGVLLRPREESLLPHQGPHPGRCCPPPSPSRSRSATAARGHNGMQQEEGEAARAAQR